MSATLKMLLLLAPGETVIYAGNAYTLRQEVELLCGGSEALSANPARQPAALDFPGVIVPAGQSVEVQGLTLRVLADTALPASHIERLAHKI